ncbi:hypothetical protein PG996_012553 [Apiospora saccharicola]|uniref:Protein kinase domain-containing protein n=1 Tax=Apiospora saccharicola TaxID=335842 RepID=A0ABR1U2W9_9PEZI
MVSTGSLELEVLLRYTSGGHVQYKLCDFGPSVLYSPTDDASVSYCGTRGYIAPHTIHYGYLFAFDPKSRPDSKELLESSSRHVDKTVLALATRHDSRPSSSTNETVTAILGSSQPVISDYVEGVPFRPSEHDSGASGQVGEAIPIPSGLHQRDTAQHSDKTDPNQAWIHELDNLSHVDARIDTLVTELESKALSPIRATVPALAMRHDSGNASGGKSESQATKPSFGSGSATKGSFLSSQVSESAKSKNRGASQTTTPVLRSLTVQNEVDAGWPLKTAPFMIPYQKAEQSFPKTSEKRLCGQRAAATSKDHGSLKPCSQNNPRSPPLPKSLSI